MITILSLMVLAILALTAGAVMLMRRGGFTKQLMLMLVMAAVMAVNVAIWTIPDVAGQPPLGRALD